jgi:hypothetical protein
MATAAQIAANRANAQKSSGPRSVEGKAASRFNALKHGMDAESIVLPGEDAEAYRQLAENYYRDFRPGHVNQQFHVDTLIRCDWQRRRLQRSEAKLYRALLAEGTDPEDLDIAILRDSPTAKLLRKVSSQIASLERAYHRAVNELRRLEHNNRKAESAYIDAMIDAACAPIDLQLASFHEKRERAAAAAQTGPQSVPLSAMAPSVRTDRPAVPK